MNAYQSLTGALLSSIYSIGEVNEAAKKPALLSYGSCFTLFLALQFR